jgi:hypothetical protein
MHGWWKLETKFQQVSLKERYHFEDTRANVLLILKLSLFTVKADLRQLRG